MGKRKCKSSTGNEACCTAADFTTPDLNDLSVIAVKQPEFTAAAAGADVADFSAAHCLQMLNTKCS